MKRRNFIFQQVALGLGVMASPELLVKGNGMMDGSGTADATFDVAVFGATPSGIVSAVRLAREGHRVLLVSVFEHIGGTLVNGLSVMDTMYEGNRSPLYEELLQLIRDHYTSTYGKDSDQYKMTLFGNRLTPGARPRYEAGVVARILDELVAKEARITVWRKVDVVNAEATGRIIRRISLKSFDDGSIRTVAAKIFIDASYEGDLAAIAKVQYVVGREGRSEFNEQHAGKIFAVRAPGSFPYEGAVGLINLRTFQVVTTQTFAGSTGTGDKAIQAYNVRFILTDDPAKFIPIQRPASYDRAVYAGITAKDRASSVTRYPLKADLLVGPVESINPGGMKVMNNKYGNNGGNFTGRNWDYPEANWERRRQIIKEHIDHGLGLMYFLQHDDTVPETLRKKALQYGLSSDEFADNGHVPYEVYVREARRIRGRYVFTENDGTLVDGIDRSRIHDDSIAITEWPMDSHDCTTERKPGSLHDGVILLTEMTRPAQVPYRILLPKAIDNLLVTVCMSCTHIGWGTLRVEPTFMHIAESAAYAASLAIRKEIQPAAIHVPELQHLLVDRKIMLSFFNEFDMSVDEPWVAAIQYLGTKGFFTGYNAKPADPLTRSEADHWIRSLKQIVSTKYDPYVLAQNLFASAGPADDHITGSEFSEKLKAVTKKEGTETSIANDKTISKRDAALAIYLYLKNKTV